MHTGYPCQWLAYWVSLPVICIVGIPASDWSLTHLFDRSSLNTGTSKHRWQDGIDMPDSCKFDHEKHELIFFSPANLHFSVFSPLNSTFSQNNLLFSPPPPFSPHIFMFAQVWDLWWARLMQTCGTQINNFWCLSVPNCCPSTATVGRLCHCATVTLSWRAREHGHRHMMERTLWSLQESKCLVGLPTQPAFFCPITKIKWVLYNCIFLWSKAH
jgi:hypothetical protein